MHLSTYLKPVQADKYFSIQKGKQLKDVLRIYTDTGGIPDLRQVDIAIVGVEDDRNAVNNEGCGMAAQSVREYFYHLRPGSSSVQIADLGDIAKGNSTEDTYFALSQVVEQLLISGIVPVVIGGGQDLTYAMYRAFKNRQQVINIAAVDNQFDLGSDKIPINSQSYLSHILLHKPNFLFNFTNIGYQTYFVEQDAVDLMRNLYFDSYRLGIVHSDIYLAEPLLRNADLLTFDISAIRQSDAPGNANATPNGFYGEEACQLTRFAGLSDKISAVGFFEMNPVYDRNGQTAHLLAQMIWYFIEGFEHRLNEQPVAASEAFLRYNVQISGFDGGIVFFKSKATERWWMEVKCTENIREKYIRHYIIPCSPEDYQTALANEIPDRWWQACQKLM